MATLDFTNTELAFRHLNNTQLAKAHRLFRMMGNPFLVKIGPSVVNTMFTIGLPVEGLVKSMLFDQFCGGTDLKDTDQRMRELAKFGVGTILDYSVEGEKTNTGFDVCRDEIIRAIQFGKTRDEVTFTALKITGLADFGLLERLQKGSLKSLATNEKVIETESKIFGAGNGSLEFIGEILDELHQQEYRRAYDRLDAICAEAARAGKPIFIDAEESWIQNVIDDLAEEMMARYNRGKAIVYTTVQMYRHDRLAYLERLIHACRKEGIHLGVKIVRGAYMEKENERAQDMGYPTPIQPDKAATDRDYNAALELCIRNIDAVSLCAGTHNEDSSRLLANLCDSAQIPSNHPNISFAQLLGMSDHISFILAANGFRAAKYVPYGPVKAVLPYLFRRANENTSIAGQTGRELRLLTQEMKRRKLH